MTTSIGSSHLDTQHDALIPGLTVIIPVYNSETLLPKTIEELTSELKSIGLSYEIILVNDCSHDDSWNVVSELASKHADIQGINLTKNCGQHNAILCGIRMARYNTIVTTDDDLQHPPDRIKDLLSKLDEGYDVVYGSPEAEQHGLLRNLASQTTKMVLKSVMGAETSRHISAFRAFRTCLREAFSRQMGSFVSIDVLLTWATSRFTHVVVPHRPRGGGKSNYTTSKLISHAFNLITGFSVLPLQIASIVGFVLTLFGLCIFFYVVGRYFLQGTSAPGFPFLASIIAIFSGAQLCALGIIGEYLSRMHFRLMDRPSYVVRDTVNVPE